MSKRLALLASVARSPDLVLPSLQLGHLKPMCTCAPRLWWSLKRPSMCVTPPCSAPSTASQSADIGMQRNIRLAHIFAQLCVLGPSRQTVRHLGPSSSNYVKSLKGNQTVPIHPAYLYQFDDAAA